MEKREFKIYSKEIEAIIALIKLGYKVALIEDSGHCSKCCPDEQDEYWATIWGDWNQMYFHSDSEEEIRAFFSKPFLAVSPKLIVHQHGTHCGMFTYMFGWTNEASVKQENLEDAVVPQALDGIGTVKREKKNVRLDDGAPVVEIFHTK